METNAGEKSRNGGDMTMRITKAAVLITAVLLAAVVMPLWAFGQTEESVETGESAGTDWSALQEQYRQDDTVQDLIFVKYEGTRAVNDLFGNFISPVSRQAITSPLRVTTRSLPFGSAQ